MWKGRGFEIRMAAQESFPRDAQMPCAVLQQPPSSKEKLCLSKDKSSNAVAEAVAQYWDQD